MLEYRQIYAVPFSTGFNTGSKGNTPKNGYGEWFMIYISEIVNIWRRR